MLVTLYSLMYVAVVAALVVSGRKVMHTSLSSSGDTSDDTAVPEKITSGAPQESRTSTRSVGHRAVILQGTSGSSISSKDIESLLDQQAMNLDLIFERSSNFKDSTHNSVVKLNKTSELERVSVTDSDRVAAREYTHGNVKTASVSVQGSSNIAQNTSLQHIAQNTSLQHIAQNTSLQQGMMPGPPHDFSNFTLSPDTQEAKQNTEFPLESTTSDRFVMQESEQAEATHGFPHDIYINRSNYTHQTGFIQNISESSESSTIHRKIDQQRLLKLLIQQDADLNRTLAETWNFTERFLSSGDLDVGQETIDQTNLYIDTRRSWIRYMQLFPSKFKNKTDVLLGDGTLLQARVTELNVMQSALSKLKDIHRLVKVVNKTEETNFRAYSGTHNHSAGLSFAPEEEKYLNDLETAVLEMEEMWKQYNMKYLSTFSWHHSFHLVSERNGQLLESTNESIYKNDIVALQQKELEEIFQYYVYPGVYLVILVLGVVGNGVLLLMFAKHKHIRTTPNIMVFNLALADIMNLFANAPLYYVSKYHSQWIFLEGYGCKVFVTFRFLNHTVIELSIVALSAQRYCAAAAKLRRVSEQCGLSARSRTVLYIFTVWLIGLVFALPPSIVFDFRNGICFPFVRSQIVVEILDIFYFVFFCFILPILMGVFSLMTARTLRQSVRSFPGELRHRSQETARYRSAKVVTALAIAYAVSHIPRSIWFFLVSYFHLNRREMKYIFIDEVTNYLIFSNSCLNPLALYIASNTFRQLFNLHLFCIKQNQTNHRKLQRKCTEGSSTRLVFFIESDTGDLNGSKSSLKKQDLFRKGSELHVNVNPNV